MPLSWTISHPQRLLIAVAKGEVAPHEFGAYLAAVERESAAAYRKMFEVTGLTGGLDATRLQSVGRAVEEHARRSAIGPIAIVATTDEAFVAAMVYAEAAAVDRPLQIPRAARRLPLARRLGSGRDSRQRLRRLRAALRSFGSNQRVLDAGSSGLISKAGMGRIVGSARSPAPSLTL